VLAHSLFCFLVPDNVAVFPYSRKGLQVAFELFLQLTVVIFVDFQEKA
jgi:hypothetical protein